MGSHAFIGILIAAAASLAMVDSAAAQSNADRDGQTMNFDLWCQEQAGLPPARCDKRTQEDERAFESYQTGLEHFEVPYRSPEYNQGRVNRDIMNSDPIDNPQNDNLGVQRQYPDISVTNSPPK
jgi:hypothetical protein